MKGNVCQRWSVMLTRLLKCSQVAYNQSQRSSSFSIDQEQSRYGEHDLNGTIAERSEKGLVGVLQDVLENG